MSVDRTPTASFLSKYRLQSSISLISVVSHEYRFLYAEIKLSRTALFSSDNCLQRSCSNILLTAIRAVTGL